MKDLCLKTCRAPADLSRRYWSWLTMAWIQYKTASCVHVCRQVLLWIHWLGVQFRPRLACLSITVIIERVTHELKLFYFKSMEFLLVIQSALLWLAVVLFYKCCLPLILALYYGHSLFPNIILFHELFLLHQAAACCFIMDWRCKHFISQNVKVLNIIIKRKSWHWWYEYSVVYHFPPKPCLLDIESEKFFS